MKQCSKSENVLIIDSDYEEADGFIKGVREVTGEEWQVALHENNKIYGWRRYVRFFTVALQTVLSGKKYEGKTVLCWQQFYGIAIAFFQRMFHMKKRYKLVIMTFIYKEKRFGNTFLNEMGMLATVVIRHPKNISGINFFNMFNPFTGNNPCDIIYFCIGGLIYTYKDILEKVHIMKCKVLMVLGFLLNNICLFIIGILYSKITNTFWDTVWEGRSTIFVLLNVIYVFLFFMDFNKNNRLQKQSEITLKDRFCKCIEVISKNTMGIYLVHVLVLRTIEKFSIQASFTSNITVGIIYSIVVTLISLIITLCVKRIPVVGKFI